MHGPIFEVKRNAGGRWFFHELASNGQVVSISQAYRWKWNAKRAARHKAERTLGATFRVVEMEPL